MYILITPAKNEASNLPQVANSVLQQTVLPKLWVIIDDGSSDNTPDIIKKLVARYSWIKSIQLPPHPRDVTFHYSYVCKCGFDYIIDICQSASIEYEYIGLLDADTILEDTYFEKLIIEFNKENLLGIASGHIIDVPSGMVHWNILKKDRPNKKWPRGSGRLWKKKCFFETGQYLVEPSPDSISNIKALLRNWKIAQFGFILAQQLRETCSAEGVWKGYMGEGHCAYYLNKHPLLILINSIYYSTKKPYYIGFAFFYGYYSGVVHRGKKIRDPEIKEYYWNERLREYLPHFLK